MLLINCDYNYFTIFLFNFNYFNYIFNMVIYQKESNHF